MDARHLAESTEKILKHTHYLASAAFLFFFFVSCLLIPLLQDSISEASERKSNHDKISVKEENGEGLFIPSFRNNGGIPRVFGESLERDKEKSRIFLFLREKDTGLMREDERELANTIVTESEKYNQDPILILAIIMTESTFYNWSQSRADAHGLMQIKTETGSIVAKELGFSWEGRQTLFDPFVNIQCGVYYLNKMINRFKDEGIALAAYNIGPTKVRRLIMRKRKIPTRYQRKVKRNYATLKRVINSISGI